MRKLKSFLNLVRWPNLVVIAAAMFLVYYYLLSPLSYFGINNVMPPSIYFTLLVMSLIFIAAGGYAINDYFDIETDKYNKPDKLLVNKVFSEKETLFFHKILTFTGLVLGLISSIFVLKSKFYLLFAFLVLIACLLYSYSSTYKRKILVGNLLVSLLVASSVFLPYMYEVLYLTENILILSLSKDLISNLFFVMIYTAFAFLLTFIREVVKDAEDYDGDIKTHCRTIPVVYGLNKTKSTLYISILLLLILLFYYSYLLFMMELFMALSIILLVILGTIVVIFKIFKAKDKKDFSFLSKITKILMVIGVLSMLFLR